VLDPDSLNGHRSSGVLHPSHSADAVSIAESEHALDDDGDVEAGSRPDDAEEMFEFTLGPDIPGYKRRAGPLHEVRRSISAIWSQAVSMFQKL